MNRFKSAKNIVTHPWLRKKILFTIALLAIYRLLVFVPVPFADVAQVLAASWGSSEGLSQFLMLLWWSIERFSLLSVWLGPFINASIIMQLLAVVVPKLEELQEMWEQGTRQIQQYTRYLTLPLALLQGLGMVYIINTMPGLTGAIDVANFSTVFMSAFAMAVGAMMLVWFGDLITEKGISNGVSLLIFASIVAGMTMQISGSLAGTPDFVSFVSVLAFILVLILILIFGSVFLLKSVKNIPIVYARQGKVEQTSTLPIPLNPVGMIPIIFAIAFVTFPYLLAQFVTKVWSPSTFVYETSLWVLNNFNYYVANPTWIVILANFVFIVLFTFFYTLIVFNPDRIADNIQKRGGFVPGIRPGDETAKYINKTLTHLSFWWGIGLGLIGIFDKLLYKIPFVLDITQSLGTVPVVVTGSWVIIIVWVVQELTNKIETELLMSKYDTL